MVVFLTHLLLPAHSLDGILFHRRVPPPHPPQRFSSIKNTTQCPRPVLGRTQASRLRVQCTNYLTTMRNPLEYTAMFEV